MEGADRASEGAGKASDSASEEARRPTEGTMRATEGTMRASYMAAVLKSDNNRIFKMVVAITQGP